MLSQHFPAWSALWTSVWVRPGDLAMARHAQLSFKMSAAVSSISLSQSSNFVASHLSNVGMSWSKDMVRFVCCCVAHKVWVYFCVAVYRGSSTGLQVGHSWSVMASCFSLLVRCASSSTCMGGLAVSLNWLSCCWSCWKCSCNCARSLWGLVSSLNLAVV